jgi:hypothetical protein
MCVASNQEPRHVNLEAPPRVNDNHHAVGKDLCVVHDEMLDHGETRALWDT